MLLGYLLLTLVMGWRLVGIQVVTPMSTAALLTGRSSAS